MKKKLTLILSLVLVLAVAICTVVFTQANDESTTHVAQTEAIRLWKAAEDNWATSFQTGSGNGGTVYTLTSGNVSEIGLTQIGGGTPTATFTFKDGVLTLKGNGETLNFPRVASNGALWLVLDNVNVQGWFQNSTKWNGENGYPAANPTVDIPFIISSPIDTNTFMVKDDGVGGMITNPSSSSHTIRNAGSIVLLGDVGFNIAGTYGGETIHTDGSAIAKSIILAPGRNSNVTSFGYRSAYNATGASGLFVISGSIFDDAPVTITMNEDVQCPSGTFRLIDNAILRIEGDTNSNASTYGDSQLRAAKIEVTDGSTLLMNTLNGEPFDGTVTADATSTVYSEKVDGTTYTYTFPAAGNYKLGDKVIAATKGMQLQFTEAKTFVATTDAANTGVVTFVDTNDAKTVLMDVAGGGAATHNALVGSVSYDYDAKEVVVNGLKGKSLSLNVPQDFKVTVTGENALGTEDLTNVFVVSGGNVTVAGTGKLTLTSKQYGFKRTDTGRYVQTGATVEVINGTSNDAFYVESGGVELTGGTLKISSQAQYSLRAGGGILVDGENTVLEVNSPEKDNTVWHNATFEVKKGTVTIRGGENSINQGNALTKVTGGTLTVHAVNKKYAIRGGSLLVEGGTANVVSDLYYAMHTNNANGIITVNGGTLNTYFTDANGEHVTTNGLYSKEGIYFNGGTVNTVSSGSDAVRTDGTLSITGGTVTSESQTSDRALYGKNVTISQAKADVPTVVNATAKVYSINSVGDGNSIEITGGTVNVTARTGRGIQATAGTAKISGGTVTINATNDTGIEAKKLEISGGNVTVTTNNKALTVTEELIISGGTVTTTANNNVTCPKITISEADANVPTNVTLTSHQNHAISCAGTLTVSGGTLTATGKPYNAYYGVIDVYSYNQTGGDITINIENAPTNGVGLMFRKSDTVSSNFQGGSLTVVETVPGTADQIYAIWSNKADLNFCGTDVKVDLTASARTKSINSAIRAQQSVKINVSAGSIDVLGNKDTTLFRCDDTSVLNLTGGEITGVTGYFISCYDNVAPVINVGADAKIDVYYYKSVDAGLTNYTLNDSATWLPNAAWTSGKKWLTTANWLKDGSATRVLLTLADNSIYMMDLMENRFYPSETNAKFALTAQGELLNLTGSDLPVGEVLKLEANGNLILDIPANKTVNLGKVGLHNIIHVLGSLTVTGEGNLNVVASTNTIVCDKDYNQNGAVVTLTVNGGRGVDAVEKINITGGTLKVLGEKANPALDVGTELNISSTPGSLTYVYLTAGDNVIFSNGVTNISGALYDETAQTGTYVQVYSANTYGFRVGTLNISGGTVNVSATNPAIYASGDINISGGNVTATNTSGNYTIRSAGNLNISCANPAIPTNVTASGAVWVLYAAQGISISDVSLLKVTSSSGRAIQANTGDVTITNSNVDVDATNDIGILGKNVTINNSYVTVDNTNRYLGIQATETLTIEGDEYNETTKTGTYVAVTTPNRALHAKNIDIKGGTVVVRGAKIIDANSLVLAKENLTVSGGTLDVEGEADYQMSLITAKNISVTGGTLKGVITNASGNGGRVFTTTENATVNGGTLTISGEAINQALYVGGAFNVAQDEGKTTTVTITGAANLVSGNTVNVSGGTVNVTATGDYGIRVTNVNVSGGTVKVTAEKNYGMNAKSVEITGGTVSAATTTGGRAIQVSEKFSVSGNAVVTATAAKDVAIEATGMTFSGNCQVTTSAKSPVLNSLANVEISGDATVKSTSANGTNALVVAGDLIVKDTANVELIGDNCASTSGALNAYGMYMYGEKGANGPQVSVTMNSAPFVKGQLRQIHAVRFAPPAYYESKVLLEGGKLDVTVNNNYSDTTYTYNNKPNDVSANRTYGLYASADVEIVEFAGTDVTVNCNTLLNNYNSSGFMWIAGADVLVSDGNLRLNNRDGHVYAMFYNTGNESHIDLVGGKITGEAKYFWYVQNGGINNVLTVKPGAEIDFWCASGNSRSLGANNSYNGTAANWFVEDGVDYLRFCSLTQNTRFLTTGTDETTTQVEITLTEGDVSKTFVLSAENPAYPFGATAATAQAYYTPDGVVTLNGLKATQIRSNGDVKYNLKGSNEVSGNGTHRVWGTGNIAFLGDGVVNVSGTTYVIYSYRGDEIRVGEKAQVFVTATAGNAFHMNHSDEPKVSVVFTDDAKVSIQSKGVGIQIRGYETTVDILGNANVEIDSKNYAIQSNPITPAEGLSKGSVNIGENAKVTLTGTSGIQTLGQLSTVNIGGDAVVDMSLTSYPFHQAGAQISANFTGNAKVTIAEGVNDIFYQNSNLLALEGAKQAASVNVSENASVLCGTARNCGIRSSISAKNAEGKVVVGESSLNVSGNAMFEIDSKGQTVYLTANAEGSVGAIRVKDNANMNVINLSDTGYSAVQYNAYQSILELTTKGTVNFTGSVPGNNGLVKISHATNGINKVLIKDATVNVTNIQSTEKETLNASGTNTYAGNKSIAFYLVNESEVEICGRAKLNVHVERNGKKYKNTAFGLYLTAAKAGTMAVKISDNAQVNCVAGGDSALDIASAIQVKNCDITVTDNAVLRGTAKGTALNALTFEGTSTLTVEKYGRTYFTGAEKGNGIAGYNTSAKPTVTVKDGGILLATGKVATNLKNGTFTYAASKMEAGATKEEAAELKLDVLPRNYLKYGYVLLTGDMPNPNTSDLTLPTIVAVTVLVAAAAVAVVIVRKKKNQAN